MNRFTVPAIAATFAGILALTACGGHTPEDPVRPAPATVTETATPEPIETNTIPRACITALNIAQQVQKINIKFVEEVATGYIGLIPEAHEAGLRGDTEGAAIVDKMGKLTDETKTLTGDINALQADMAAASSECRASTGSGS